MRRGTQIDGSLEDPGRTRSPAPSTGPGRRQGAHLPERHPLGLLSEARGHRARRANPNATDASRAAVGCAKKSYAALKQFLAGDPPAIKEAVTRGAEQGITGKFYLWTNDYQRATATVVPREARLWYWKRVEPDSKRPPGFWKWEATLAQDGTCTVPSQPQIDEALEKVIEGIR